MTKYQNMIKQCDEMIDVLHAAAVSAVFLVLIPLLDVTPNRLITCLLMGDNPQMGLW